ncbi:MAG: hypothetical protein E7663_02295 [Ruminococcaceae bacterium]|nr:hypothetical protein [Oscillospiraceae bacterium]
MLRKLLKYDIKSLKRMCLPALLILAILTAVAIPVMVLFVKATERVALTDGSFFDQLTVVGGAFFILATVFALIAAIALPTIGVLIDFYRTLTTDEAYLTFTLPVKPRRLLLSKLLNSAIWSAVMGAAALLSAFIILLTIGIAVGAEGGSDLSTEEILLPAADILSSAITKILAVIFVVISFINTQLLYFMAIFFASVITQKNKLLTAIAMVIGAYFSYSTLSGIFSLILSLILGLSGAIYTHPSLASIITLSVYILFLSGMSYLFFRLTEHMMEKKLNLA